MEALEQEIRKSFWEKIKGPVSRYAVLGLLMGAANCFIDSEKGDAQKEQADVQKEVKQNIPCHPGAKEECNGLDDDCNGETDERGVCVFCDEYPDYSLKEGKCCTEGEKGGLMCIADVFYSFVPALTSLAWDGQHLRAASDDYDNEKIYTLTATGKIINSFNSPGGSPQGLAWDGKHLWNANQYGERKIYELTTMGTVVSSFDLFGEDPTGLTWDGKFLWQADEGYDKIYKVATTGKVLTSIDSPGDEPSDLASGWDGNYLWNADPGNDKIYKLSITGEIINSFDSPGESPQGLAWDGQYLWHADTTYGENKLYKLEIIEE